MFRSKILPDCDPIASGPATLAADPGDLRRRVLAGAIGNTVEWYDFAIYGYFAPLIGRAFFPNSDRAAQLMAAYAVFALAFLFRPLGSVVFGHIADRVGRRAALVLSVGVMAASTFAVGMLPAYDSIGLVAPALLLLLRALQGLSVGGEFTTSMAFIAEQSPPKWRGFNTSLASTSAVLGLVIGSAFSAVLQGALGQAAMAAWGWRLPFLFGLMLGVICFATRRTLLADLPATPPQERGERLPIVEAVTAEGGAILRTFLTSSLHGILFYVGFVYLLTFEQRYDGLPPAITLWFMTLSQLLMAVLFPLFGALSDRIGRLRVMQASAVATFVLAWPLFRLLSQHNPVIVLLGQVAYTTLFCAYVGPVPAMLTEQFATRTRASGAALSYNAAMALFGGTTPVIVVWLTAVTGRPLIVAAWLMLGTVLGVIGVRLSDDRTGLPLR